MSTETTPTDGTAPADSAPEPARSFDDLPLSDPMRQALQEMGYDEPTAVQAALWEPAAAGRDVVVQARTGTGKTAAFGIPMLERLLRPSLRAAQALVLCPTRELALQVCREIDRLGAHKSVRTVAVYGGASMSKQIDAIAAGAALVVGTPGRVLDHLRRETLDPSAIRCVVLDESDEMLSMGFEKELTAILEHLPERRQTMLLSATLPPDIERLARSRLHDPEFVTLSGDHIGALGVAHFTYLVTADKPGALVQVLEVENPESAIIFCNTRAHTHQLAQHLRGRGFRADWLNGDLPQPEREKVMNATRKGQLRFLVATDVAARGIDISHLSHVINYDFPRDPESYVHRTGRTGRLNRTGTAISLVTPQDLGAVYILRLTYQIRPVQRWLPTAGEQRTRLETDIVMSLAETFAPRGAEPRHRALARRLLSHDDAEAVVAGMLREHLAANPEFGAESAARRRGACPPPQPSSPDVPPVRPDPSDGGEQSSATGSAQQETAQERAVPRALASDDDEEPSAPTTSASEATASSLPHARRRRTRSADPQPDSEDGDGVERDRAEGEPELVELHLDAGRQDDLRARKLREVLAADGSIPRRAVKGIRIRERYSFVHVEKPYVDDALEVLRTAELVSRPVEASISDRSARP